MFFVCNIAVVLHYYYLQYYCRETVVLRRWGVLEDNLVLSTGLLMWIGHRKGIRELRPVSVEVITPGRFYNICSGQTLHQYHPITSPTVKTRMEEPSGLRVRVPKNQKLSGKFQTFKIAQTLAFSGPY